MTIMQFDSNQQVNHEIIHTLDLQPKNETDNFLLRMLNTGITGFERALGGPYFTLLTLHSADLLRRIVGVSFAEDLLRNTNALNTHPLRSWFYSSLSSFADSDSLPTYYEFGVGWGATLLNYWNALRAFCRDRNRDIYDFQIFLFDSFEGLPQKEDFRDNHPDWKKGKFGYGLGNIRRLLARQRIDLSRGNIHFITGFYQDSLTAKLRSELANRPPSIINIDVDYYSSTKTILEWLRPMMEKAGKEVLLYFDDLWAFGGDPNLGELAAILEFNRSSPGRLIPNTQLNTRGIAARCLSFLP